MASEHRSAASNDAQRHRTTTADGAQFDRDSDDVDAQPIATRTRVPPERDPKTDTGTDASGTDGTESVDDDPIYPQTRVP